MFGDHSPIISKYRWRKKWMPKDNALHIPRRKSSHFLRITTEANLNVLMTICSVLDILYHYMPWSEQVQHVRVQNLLKAIDIYVYCLYWKLFDRNQKWSSQDLNPMIIRMIAMNSSVDPTLTLLPPGCTISYMNHYPTLVLTTYKQVNKNTATPTPFLVLGTSDIVISNNTRHLPHF